MQTFWVVKCCDVTQDILLSLIATLVVFPLHKFLFQAAKEAFNNRGVAKAASGDPNGAIIDFTSSIKIDKTYLEPVLNRSFVLEMQGKLDQACEDWKTASQLGSRDAQTWLKAQCKI